MCVWENQNYADEFLASNTHKVARPSSLATTPVLQVMRSRSFQDYLLKVSTQRKISRLWKFLYPIGKYSFLSNQRTLPNKFDKDEKNHLKVSFSWHFGVFWVIFAHFQSDFWWEFDVSEKIEMIRLLGTREK